MIEVVSATRLSLDQFWKSSPLGISLLRIQHDARISAAHIAYQNQLGLPSVYNSRIDAAAAPFLVFVHDDVWIDDFFLSNRLLAGLERYDILGVAGNRRRVPQQPAWLFSDAQFTRDLANLSGAVAHGDHPFGSISWFGETPADCETLDGVFLAARVSALRDRKVRFDERFDFHFYDMDFCRTARSHGLRVGTWPICLTHQSAGAFGTDRWRSGYATYLEKWGD